MEDAKFRVTLLKELSGFVHTVPCLFEPGTRAVGNKHGFL